MKLDEEKNESEYFRREFSKVFIQKTVPVSPNKSMYPSPNIINIVNNVQKDNGKEKKIDLKMNINRYDIKCYLSNSYRIKNLFNEFKEKKRHSTVIPECSESRNRKELQQMFDINHSEEGLKRKLSYKKCFSVRKRHKIKLLVTTDDEEEDSDYEPVENKGSRLNKTKRIKAKILKLLTLDNKKRSRNHYLDYSFENNEEFFDTSLDRTAIDGNKRHQSKKIDENKQSKMISLNQTTTTEVRIEEPTKKRSILNLDHKNKSSSPSQNCLFKKKQIKIEANTRESTDRKKKEDNLQHQQHHTKKHVQVQEQEQVKEQQKSNKKKQNNEPIPILKRDFIGFSIANITNTNNNTNNNSNTNTNNNSIEKFNDPIYKKDFLISKSNLCHVENTKIEDIDNLQAKTNKTLRDLQIEQSKPKFKVSNSGLNNTTKSNQMGISYQTYSRKPSSKRSILVINHNRNPLNTFQKTKNINKSTLNISNRNKRSNIFDISNSESILSSTNRGSTSKRVMNSILHQSNKHPISIRKSILEINNESSTSILSPSHIISIRKSVLNKNNSSVNSLIQSHQIPTGNNSLLDKNKQSTASILPKHQISKQNSIFENNNELPQSIKTSNSILENYNESSTFELPKQSIPKIKSQLGKYNELSTFDLLSYPKQKRNSVINISNKLPASPIKRQSISKRRSQIDLNSKSYASPFHKQHISKKKSQIDLNNKSPTPVLSNNNSKSKRKTILEKNTEASISFSPSTPQLISIQNQNETDSNDDNSKDKLNNTIKEVTEMQTRTKEFISKKSGKRGSIIVSNRKLSKINNQSYQNIKNFKRKTNKEQDRCLSPWKRITRKFDFTVLDHIKDTSFNDSDVDSSFSRTECQMVVKKIFKSIKEEEEDNKRLNGSYSYDEIDFEDDEYTKGLNKFKKEILGMQERYDLMTQKIDIRKTALLSKSNKQISNFLLNKKQNDIKNNYLIELKSYIDNVYNTKIVDYFYFLNLPININHLALVNDKYKETIMNRYFDLQKEITVDLLIKGRSSKKMQNSIRSLQVMKSSMFIMSNISKLTLTKADNLLFINQFIKRDITEQLNPGTEQDVRNKEIAHAIFEFKKSATLRLRSLGNKSFKKRVRSRYTISNIFEKDIPIRDKNRKKTVNIKPLSIVRRDNQTEKPFSFNLSSRIICNKILNPLNNKFKVQNYKKRIKKQRTLFSSQNKEITMIQTNEIKNRFINSIGENIYEKIIYHIKDCNISHLKDLLAKNLISLDVNYQDKDGNTFLIFAIQSNSYLITQLLLSKGCNPNICNNLNLSPLHYALSLKDFKIANLLLSNGANENILNIDGKNAWETLGIPLE